MEAKVKVIKEAELKELKKGLEGLKRQEIEKKLAKRYHHVRRAQPHLHSSA